jgi:hypothetical protein
MLAVDGGEGQQGIWAHPRARLWAGWRLTPAEAIQKWIAEATLEELLTSKHFFSLTTASNVQRAVCRVVDGLPLGQLANDPAVHRLMGGAVPPSERPLEVSWLAAIRVAKSLTAAAGCVRMSQVCEIPDWLKPGDIPRIPILSLDLERAQAVMNHIVGTVGSSPMLKMIVIGEPTAAGIALRHPSGRPIVVKVLAGKRAGNAVSAFWLAGCIFDEFGKMHGETDAVVNWDETRAAALDRILPGGQIWNVGSPWAPEGPAHKQFITHWGKPSARLVVMRSPGADTNPSWWTPERIELARVHNPNFRTDVMAEFGTPEESFFSADLIRESTRRELQLPRDQGGDYAAFIDPATRGNAFTLVIVSRRGPRLIVVRACEWIGSKDAPLDTAQVLREIISECEPYGITSAMTDQYMGDALVSQARELYDEAGERMPAFSLMQWTLTEAKKLSCALCFRTKLAASEVELCPVTTWRLGTVEQTNNLALDMQRVRKKLTQAAAVVHLPLTTDGRHVDFWPPMGMAVMQYLDDVRPEAKAEDPEVTRMREQAIRRYSGAEEDED